MDKIKVLYINSLFGKVGGAEKNMYDIVCNINHERFMPFVFCLKGGELLEELKAKGISTKDFDLDKILGFEAIKKGMELFRFIKKEKIQVVVTYHHDADIWGGIIARLAGVPVVISSRRDLGYQLQGKHIWVYRVLNRFYTGIISVSDAVKKEIVKRDWASPRKVLTVYNGVPCDEYRYGGNEDDIRAVKESLGIDQSKTVIGMVAAFRPIKGHTNLVKAMARVIKENKNVSVVIVGYKKTEYYKEVQRLIKEFGLEEYFICLGDRRDIPRVLSTFDMLVLPSVSEGFPNAVIEAMAAGKPTIVTDSGGSLEAIVDNVTGLSVPPCDDTALSEAIQKLLENTELRRSMGEEGRIRAVRVFSLKRMIGTTEELYEYLLSGRLEAGFGYLRASRKQAVKKAIKLTASRVLYYTGTTFIYKKIVPQEFKVLAYHSIDKVLIRSLEIEQDTKTFERQMEHLKRNFRILSLSELLDCKMNGNKYPDNAVAVTFDDGYRDNYLHAFPILKKYKIPAAIFLTTDPIEANKPLAFDLIRYGIMNSPRLILDLQDVGLKKYLIDKGNPNLLAEAIGDTMGLAKAMDGISKERFLRDIYGRLDLDFEEMEKKRIYLSWEEVSEMADNGIEFGGHTKTHPQLSSLSFEECKTEMVQSKRIIEERINRKVRALAYPFGEGKDFNEMVERAAREAGYECAFSLVYNSSDRNNYDYTIGRKMVDSHMTTSFNGEFNKALFESGMINLL